MKTVNYTFPSNFVDFALSAVTMHAKKLDSKNSASIFYCLKAANTTAVPAMVNRPAANINLASRWLLLLYSYHAA